MKKMILYFFSFLVLLCVGIFLLISIYPSFGGNPTNDQKRTFQSLKNYGAGKFVNQVPIRMGQSPSGFLSMVKDSLVGGKDRNPPGKIDISTINWNQIQSEKDSLTWLGHSAFLLSIDNKKILLDPMLGPIASPVPLLGSKRYTGDMLHIIDEMPLIDAVFISHDHYDHLDYPSILKLKGKTARFFVPLGVSSHLIRWGVAKEKITEFNWWDEKKYQGLTVAFTPSRHFSGRTLINFNTTLWGGWVILGKNTHLYTSGDGGYGSHFKEIGNQYGPFDISLLDGGQYDQRWPSVHMTPEEAVQAHLDAKGKNMMLMHWGGFTLAFHGWKEPIERALKAAQKENVNLIAPKIGETVFFDAGLSDHTSPWWNL